ncbi:DNA/RNA non-specific endonuclease [Xanthomonas hortorum]|uniref:DNA/RNA non-specific endonuclease n=1 Tax=Xanthomonas hortorum pv. pelargonii TaxID=453602 RepID=A0A6V7EQY0_9XANT|nr:DNA/RNA non-specific endonuclease [Xanthomonas hortorum]MCE4352405.1 DNA/RNA non-specific endonuclease [Xanthomonas hortorum pv. pelargonii]MCM5524200.1 DNA/RNA non-specific endonuclease [Xanthomonas hortorum pv. pelargonii]MCM5535828.1 DNA/RNA non-specific endonuclease [Xanthomonas hortorum pv. pelargonii]MCM5539898.1 DNA/RNA non-specific endonuclease [Xanthomonas hortorum pv. pelargonii]MCM5546263.1 DNA/RNA non-specific endonuclease [Xanthomonas hortorum pv. pelargonii]
MRFRTFFAVLLLTAFSATANAQVVTLNKGGYTLSYDCTNHTALRYEYVLQADTGSAARPSSFNLDTELPSGCAGQTSTASYASVRTGYDRGHLVTSNHMDYNATYIRRANLMSNIVPQVASFNQGIWVRAENVAECYRDIASVQVYGGVIYSDTTNDYFLTSHGIRTPDFFWKTIITANPSGGTRAISWLIPNSATLGSLDSYIVSIDELEDLYGASAIGITAPAAVKAMLPATTWPQPSNCDLS